MFRDAKLAKFRLACRAEIVLNAGVLAPSEARYVELIHLSDLHFGANHRFSPELPPSGGAPKQPDYPDLADSLIKDLSDPKNEPPRPNMGLRVAGTGGWSVPPMPKLFCLSGDFATKASKEEFAEAVNFVKKLANPPSAQIQPTPEGFVVCPGNHDLDWEAGTVPLRWQAYANFLNDIYPDKYYPKNAMRFGGVKEFKNIGVLVLSLNSEMGVFKNSDDQSGSAFDGRAHRRRIFAKVR